MKKLPIGIQSFKELRERNYLYIDKTPIIYELTDQGKYYFLSRPRRFGKSLLISTLEELFTGNRDLFEELWIENRWDWSNANPVIRIDFSKLDYKNLGLEQAIQLNLDKMASKYNILLESPTPALQFAELVERIAEQKGKVVLLFDEYDKPITDYLTDIERAKENREILKNFYSVVKGLDEYIHFLLMTGVSKFSRTNIFSVLNHLQDITTHRNYTALCGYTQEEVEAYFHEHIDHTTRLLEISVANLLSEVRTWYNGYSWDGRKRIYNPFSILQFFSTADFGNYWFESGTPTFLIDLLKDRNVYDLSDSRVGSTVFNSYELENIGTYALLFQTGYLTVKEVDRPLDTWILDYPNREVKISFLQYLLAAYCEVNYEESIPAVQQLRAAFENDDLEAVIRTINGMFATIAYQLFAKKSENYYHSLVHITFNFLGQYIQSEINTSKGRIDAAVETQDRVYIKLVRPVFSKAKTTLFTYILHPEASGSLRSAAMRFIPRTRDEKYKQKSLIFAI